MLLEAWEEGQFGLSEQTIGEEAGSSARGFRLAHALRKHPALGTMIRSPRRGIFFSGCAGIPEKSHILTQFAHRAHTRLVGRGWPSSPTPARTRQVSAAAPEMVGR